MRTLSAIAPVDGPMPWEPADPLQGVRPLTAVEEFAAHHEALDGADQRYQRLLPAAPPAPGQQYAFAVDLDLCTSCKACVAACHSLNGLDEGESWRTVTLARSSAGGLPVQQTVTAACHHCGDPACLRGCPVDAYEKDPLTGIVVHLDDQCIGCRYCTLTCPYEVPVYNQRHGIVRKCDMCAGRLSAGEPPACAQACPNGAITITVVDTVALTGPGDGSDHRMAPTLPLSQYTRPSTQYRGRARPTADWVSGAAPAPAHAHWPLTVMLVMTQASVGSFVIELVRRSWPAAADGAGPSSGILIALLVCFVGLAASVLHLGRPRYAYRAVIGFRHSWLSREVVAFGLYAITATAYVAGRVTATIGPAPLEALGFLAGAAGIIGIGCSIAVYACTHRASWSSVAVTWRFGATSLLCGAALAATATSLSGNASRTRPLLALVLMTAAAKLAAEAVTLRLRPPYAPTLRPSAAHRFLLMTAVAVVLPLSLLATAPASGLVLVVAVGALAGELIERWQFFTASAPPR